MNHWNGKLWHAYGTSMTSTSWGKYVPVVQELSGMTVVNHGIPGGRPKPAGVEIIKLSCVPETNANSCCHFAVSSAIVCIRLSELAAQPTFDNL